MIAVARAMPDRSRDGHHMSDGGLTVKEIVPVVPGTKNRS
jgi:hypothetical protein